MTAVTPHTQPVPVQTVPCDLMGSHAQHWMSFGLTAPDQVPPLLQQAVDHSGLARGLWPAQSPLPEDFWCLQDDRSAVGVVQLIEVKNGHPVGLRNAFPWVHSPHQYRARLHQIIHCPDTDDAVLELVVAGVRVFAFDPFYRLNAPLYQAQQDYQVYLGGLVHQLEKVSSEDVLEITDPEAIRYHRGLNAILAEAPDLDDETLQQRLQDWQPEGEEDLLPVTVNLSHMAAYLQGDQPGQQDEAWIAGKIIGQSRCRYAGHDFVLHDVVIQREDPDQPLVVRLAQSVNQFADSDHIFTVGDYVRGNIWLQGSIYAMSSGLEPPLS